MGPPICDAIRAIVKIPGAPEREYTRGEAESIEEFEARMVRELPIRYEGRELWTDRGGPGLGMMCILLFSLEVAHTHLVEGLWPPEDSALPDAIQ